METTDRYKGLETLAGEIRVAVSQFKDSTTSQKTSVSKKLEVLHVPPATSPDETPSQVMADLSTKISALAEQIGAIASDQMLLDSLWFTSIKDRQEKVAQSYGETFKWVLNPASPTKFEDWLRNKNGIYWITGKPGSGKSTLMKYLINHPDTAAITSEWAGVNKPVIASFFFWNAGTAVQKSQEGLFRSLLYEILRQCPDMIPTVCASKAETFRPYVKELVPWTQQELWNAIRQLQKFSGSSVRFCIFIDGLDEYDGEPDHLVEVLESLRTWQDIKLCVSSRPWNEFIDAFGRPDDAALAMENLTQEDIRLYVRETLEESLLFRRLQERDIRSQSLVQEIVEKARGVFLWVVLVVRSLLTGLRNEDRVLDLQSRLRNFPETLEKYFSHMFVSVEPIYREHTAQTFAIALEAAEPLPLLTYSLLDEEDLDALLKSTGQEMTCASLEERCNIMRRRLNGRYKGLLEVVGSGLSRHEWKSLNVDFLHRTVYDFLRTKDMQNLFEGNLSLGFEPKVLLCKALFAQMKLIELSKAAQSGELQELLEDLVHYASKLELVSGTSQTGLMDDVTEFVCKHQRLFDLGSEGRSDFLRFIVQRGMCLYLVEILARKSADSPALKTLLLSSAIDSQRTKYSSNSYHPRIVQILLTNGASPNSRYMEGTVWGSFLLRLHQSSTTVPGDELKQIIESLLRYGADRNYRVVTGQKTIPAQRSTGRAADLHRRTSRSVENEYTSAKSILRRSLGQEIEEVLSKTQIAQSQSKPLIPRLMSGKLFQRLRGS